LSYQDKICFILGTRPEAIKLAPVIWASRRRGIGCEICATGQHREMLYQALSFFNLVPDTDLSIMHKDQALPSLTARAISKLGSYLAGKRFSLVVVQGDTTTTFCAALAAFYSGISVGHVEAGLRTGNKLAPYPEEVNRLLTTRLTDLHFAPTEQARENLLCEGISPRDIFLTGNTVVDALQIAAERVATAPEIPGLESQELQGRRLVLVTSHRREAFGDGIAAICDSVAELALRFPELVFVYVVHLNPNVSVPVKQRLEGIHNVLLLSPLEYLPFVWLLKRCTLVLTDSGGIQEEAPTFGKPVLVMREMTERPEGIRAGVARLVGTSKHTIVAEAIKLLTDDNEYEAMSHSSNPYGDGQASERIIDLCERVLTEGFTYK
jgi:UDP-N-acetylglucosamine 2-epimerase (non-hydrolysing)